MGTQTGETVESVAHGGRLADLEAVLVPLVPALERLHAAQVEQRRQAIQAELEEDLGVQGLREVLRIAAIPPTDRQRLGQTLMQMARLVQDLREQGRRNADLLSAAMDAARRTRQILERLSGADNTYDQVKTRRMLAARRACAEATRIAPPAIT
jgi:hypothetical protein